MIALRDKKAAEKEKNKEARMLQRIVNKEKKKAKVYAVLARKCERLRKLVFAEIEDGDIGAACFMDPIIDPSGCGKS